MSAELLFSGKSTAVTELTDSSFQNTANEGKWIVLHYAHWCGHCVTYAPEYIALAETFRSSIKFGAIDCATSLTTCTAHDVKLYPTVLLFENGVKVRDIVKSDLKKEVIELGGGVAVHGANSLRTKTLFTTANVLNDASLAMRTLIEREVFRGATRELHGADLHNLKQLLHLCLTLPFNKGTQNGCTSVSRAIADKTSLERTEYTQLVSKHVSDALDDEYESCKDFSCGMWRLLHLISVAAPSGELSIRFLVDTYFSCAVCREHFLAHFDACDFNRPSCSKTPTNADVIAWLYRLHNSVNVRLGKPEWSLADPVQTLTELYTGTAPEVKESSGTLLVVSLVALIMFGVYRALGLYFPSFRKKYKPII